MSGAAGAATRRSRLFVAVTPPDEVLDAIAGLPRPDEPGVRWTTRPSWHVTLRFLGNDVDEDEALAAVDALVAPPAVAELGPAVSRLGRNVVCLPVAGLDALAATVREATADVGDPPEARRFAGHLTLARLKHRAACGVAGTAFQARFDVQAVELVRSILGQSGPTYEVLARQPLTG